MTSRKQSGYLKNAAREAMHKYVESTGTEGARRDSFRNYLSAQFRDDADKAKYLHEEYITLLADSVWDEQPRKSGPDLFVFADIPVPDFITRSTIDDNGNIQYEKVSAKFATVEDLFQDAQIKMRNAAQASTAAAKIYDCAQAALKIARGNRYAFLRDLAKELVDA